MERCKVDGKFVTACKTLENSCEYGNPRGKAKGNFCWDLKSMNIMRSTRRMFGAKSGQYTEKGIIFNFCPFCGTDLTESQEA